MKQIWREICEGIELKIVLVALLSITFILILALILVSILLSKEVTNPQQNPSILNLFINPLQTNFTT